MNDPFYDALTNSKVYWLFGAVNKHAFGKIENLEPSELARIDRAVNKTLAGISHAPGDMPEPSDIGEFAFRVHAVTNSLFELNHMVSVFRSIPIRALNISPSEQLKMFLGHYLNLIYTLQEKLLRLWSSALPFAKDEEAQSNFCLTTSKGSAKNTGSTKKKIVEQYLLPFKQMVDHRDRWIHDQPFIEKDLERLSMIETLSFFSKFDSMDEDDYHLILEKERKKIMRELKKSYSAQASANSLRTINIVDAMVGELLRQVKLPL